MIKKLIIVFTLFWATVGSVYAEKIRLGLAFGLSEADMRLHYEGTGTPIYEKRGFDDLCGGLVVDFPLLWKFSLSSGVLYMRKGFDATLSNWGMHDSILQIQMRLGYLEFPLIFKINPIPYAHIGAGPYIAREIVKKVIIEASLDWSDKLRTKPWETGFTFEAGIDFTFLKKSHSLEVRYDKGITRIYTNYEDSYSHQVLSFLYTIYF